MQLDWSRVLEIVVSGLVSYLLGHRRGRSVYRTGDYRVYKPPED